MLCHFLSTSNIHEEPIPDGFPHAVSSRSSSSVNMRQTEEAKGMQFLANATGQAGPTIPTYTVLHRACSLVTHSEALLPMYRLCLQIAAALY
mmetsp:Transcript_45969/g.72014  ORF Transcript_45969/g.72014 Transcript_45969/m.72014 type:complete len:92 (+) Transcript_45969:197-472(+)